VKKLFIYVSSMGASGGIERVISNLIREWSSKYDIILCTKDKGDSFYPIPNSIQRLSLNCAVKMDMNNRFKRIKSVIMDFFLARKELSKALKSIKPDYVYTTTPMDALKVYSVGKAWRKSLVASEHGSIEGYNKIYNVIKHFLYPRIYCVSVPNRMDTESYKEWGANSVYIPHILTFENNSNNELTKKVILNVGRMTADKQQAFLLTIWSSIKDKNGWQLWIVGDGEEKEIIKETIEMHGLEDSVKIIKPTKSIDDIYKQASIFALSSRVEGFGMVLLEAMSFGIPCISFDCPSGPRDVVKDGYNGFLIENMNEKEYARKLQEMVLMSDSELQELGNNAFETVKNWDNEGILAKWDAVFK